MHSSMKLKISLMAFIAVVGVLFFLSCLIAPNKSAPEGVKHNEKIGKPQAPVILVSSPKVLLQPHKVASTDIELAVKASDLFIDQVTLTPSAGLLVELPSTPMKDINAPGVRLPITFLPMPNGRYYLHVDVKVKSALANTSPDLTHKAMAVIIQVGTTPEPEVKLQKISQEKNIEILPAQEN